MGLVSQEKWDKTKALIGELEWIVQEARDTNSVPRQRLLEIRGFLNYVVRTYPWMNPYLKGLHLTIDGWREGREAGGWRGKGSKSFPGRRAHDEELGGNGLRTGPVEEVDEPERVLP